jgi:hypothetical protein
VDRIDYSFDDDIDAIRIGSADIVAKLCMAIRSMVLAISMSPRESGYTDKLGILKGKKRRLEGRMRDSVGRCLRQLIT